MTHTKFVEVDGFYEHHKLDSFEGAAAMRLLGIRPAADTKGRQFILRTEGHQLLRYFRDRKMKKFKQKLKKLLTLGF